MQKFTRELQVSVPIEKDDLVEFSVASSEPFFRADDDLNEGYYEVLEISDQAIDFSRLVDEKAPFLFEHDTEKQIGVVEKAYIQDEKLKVLVRFSENDFAQSVLKDILSGIRRNVSVGYIVMETRFQQNQGDFPTVYVTRWQPYECSSVSVPADHSVGYQRNLKIGNNLSMNNEDIKEVVETVVDETKEQPTTVETVSATEEVKEEAKVLEEVDETEDILAAGELAGEEDLARQCIQEKRSLKEFKQLVKNKRNFKGNNSMENKKRYSITKAIRSIWKGTKDAEYEMNISQTASRNLQADDHDLFIPMNELRALGPGAGSGGALIRSCRQ